MTTYEIIATILLWIGLGLFTCNKADWFNTERDPELPCTLVVIFAPLVFIYDFINLYFVKPWQ